MSYLAECGDRCRPPWSQGRGQHAADTPLPNPGGRAAQTADWSFKIQKASSSFRVSDSSKTQNCDSWTHSPFADQRSQMQYAHFNNIGSSASRGLSGGSSKVKRHTTLVMEINAAYQLGKKKKKAARPNPRMSRNSGSVPESTPSIPNLGDLCAGSGPTSHGSFSAAIKNEM